MDLILVLPASHLKETHKCCLLFDIVLFLMHKECICVLMVNTKFLKSF